MKLKRTQQLNFVNTDEIAEFDYGHTKLVLQTYECSDYDEQNFVEPFDIFNVSIEIDEDQITTRTIDLFETTDWRLAHQHFMRLKEDMEDVRA